MSMHQARRVSYAPTEGLCYNPEDPLYWDAKALQQELTRAFEICHGCRMCFKYCDSFPNLFKFIDDNHDGDVTAVTVAETALVVDDCFQCKLCEVQCPYTPRDKHEFQLDFPKLLHRYTAQKTKQNGVPLRNKILANPDATAKFARTSFGLANVMNRVSAHRWFMEKTLGVHRDANLPEFASKTFEAWADKQGLMANVSTHQKPEVVLFQTCYVQNNEPHIGRDTIEVMQRNKVAVVCEKGLSCCGMPAWENGDLAQVRELAKNNIAKLLPFVEQGAKVAVINPTCSMMMRREYPELVATADKANAQKLADAVCDAGEFIWSIRKEKRFNTNFASQPKNVAYHAPCHLRTQGVGFRGRDLIRKIGPAQLSFVSECCGHDGTFGMKVESFEKSKRAGKRAFAGMGDAEAEIWATECPLAALQFEQHAGKKALHPMSILAKAYRGESFEYDKNGQRHARKTDD